ncbi:MAG: hypothetical protein QOG04_1106 [Actinomycetota bacterium]|jgi:hypothetical protein|nr:hypothetical protein [Actinomycetota bacterium]
MTRSKLFASLAVVALIGGALAAPALARGDHEKGGNGHEKKAHPAQTRMRFKLEDHSIVLGEAAMGDVSLQTRTGKEWAPLAGATLAIVMDGGDCASLITDADGKAMVVCTPMADGEYQVKVSYAGDDTHRKAQRAQGFTVGATDDGDDDDEDEPGVMPSPSPTM